MASTNSLVTKQSSNTNDLSYIKVLAESSNVKSIPSEFTFGSTSASIPVVDFSQLTSTSPDQRSKALLELGRACQEWGCFVLINHGIPETLMKASIDASLEFFELPGEEKWRYDGKSPSEPIKSGTGTVVNTANQRIHLWRDFVKTYVHPEFHCPEKPQILRDIILELTEKYRKVLRKLLDGISENLELEEGYMEKALKMESCFQLYAANLYPPCPEPDQAIGIPSHTDYGLLTFLLHNGIAGLQIEHNGHWFNINSPQNSILVNTGDHLEIFSNGRYKSLKHRALVNSEATRISVVVANGAAPDAVVGPAGPLIERDGRALYRPMKFMEYVEKILSSRVVISNLDLVKIVDEKK